MPAEKYDLLERAKILEDGRVRKAVIHKFLTKLLQIDPSTNTLASIAIGENPSDNSITTVGRPEVSCSNYKQMRYVTPYAFIKYAIV